MTLPPDRAGAAGSGASPGWPGGEPVWRVESHGLITVFRLVGEVDAAHAERLRAELETSVAEGQAVVDLSDCTFIDGAVARAIALASTVHPDRLAVVLPDDGGHPAQRILCEIYPDRFLTVGFCTSTSDAVALLTRRLEPLDVDTLSERVASARRKVWANRTDLQHRIAEQRELVLEARRLRSSRTAPPAGSQPTSP